MPETTTAITMEMDANVNDILHEVITFLECLRDAQLPLALESLREKLLERSKNTLSATRKITSSPEPYLDMNSGPKTILFTKHEGDTEEYVGMEESPQKQNRVSQDYYETFEHESQPRTTVPITTEHMEKARDEQNNAEGSQTLMDVYKNLSAAQSKSKCHKCGPLHRKESKKLFMSDNRACWMALVGSHMLIYRSERHTRPGSIYSIRGYMARPAPNLLRDRQKSDSTFEIYCPGNETLHFIARTPKDMQQWIVKICEVGCGNESAKDLDNKSNESSETLIKHGDQDNATSSRRHKVGKSTGSVKKKSLAKAEAKSNRNETGKNAAETPPPLPTRIPRRLPSIPVDDSVPSYRAVEEYDDGDDIYIKIDDLNGMAYQNVKLAKKQCVNVGDNERGKIAEYDDVHASKGRKEEQARQEKSNVVSIEEELYDDIFELSRNKVNTEREKARNGDCPGAPPSVDDGEECVYDDVENLLEKSIKERVKDQTEVLSKFSQKKSFLERVWSKRESSGKTDKKLQDKISSSATPSSSAAQATLTYNDVSDLTSHPQVSADNGVEELPEYNCPLPPRPVYTKSIVNQVDSNPIEELYDDVSICRQKYNNHQPRILQSTQESSASAKEATDNATELRMNRELPEKEIEHYQSPRSDLRVHDMNEPEYQNEELYDDIALSVNFKARQRDVNEKRDGEDGRSTIGFDKKSWNPFTVNRSRRSSELYFAETHKRNADDSEEIDDSAEASDTSKRNTFQKLISKMENSLAKVSARGPTSLPINKSNTANNNL